jgi:integrator complex subunit 6
MNELKNLTATGMTTFGSALKNSFDYLNINRMQTGIDTYGQGRCPYYLEAAIIITITDGAKYTTSTNVQSDLNLPMNNTNNPGSELTHEPFRWDQRLFSIVLRLSGTYSIDPPTTNGANFNVPCDDSQISAMCDVTGGKCYFAMLMHKNMD